MKKSVNQVRLEAVCEEELSSRINQGIDHVDLELIVAYEEFTRKRSKEGTAKSIAFILGIALIMVILPPIFAPLFLTDLTRIELLQDWSKEASFIMVALFGGPLGYYFGKAS